MIFTHENYNSNLNVVHVDKRISQVYSYNTLVAVFIDDIAYVSSEHYSRTTTRHINKAINSSPIPIHERREVPTDVLTRVLAFALAKETVKQFDSDFLEP